MNLKVISEIGVTWWPELKDEIRQLDPRLLECIEIDTDLSAKLCRYKQKQLVFDIKRTEQNLGKWGYNMPEDAIGPFVRMKFGIDLRKLFKKIRREG